MIMLNTYFISDPFTIQFLFMIDIDNIKQLIKFIDLTGYN